MLYQQNLYQEVRDILIFANELTKTIGINSAQVETELLLEVVVTTRQEFPYVGGLKRSSAFKKVANFVAFLVFFKPFKLSLPAGMIKNYNFHVDFNVLLAIEIAIFSLEKSVIHRSDGDVAVFNPIRLSDHSYVDLLDALNRFEGRPNEIYPMLALYFEQLTYKTNPHCEYGFTLDANKNLVKDSVKESIYYPGVYSVTEGDDFLGV